MMAAANGGITRRTLIRGATAAAALGVAGTALAACGTTGRTTAQHVTTTLVMQPNGPTTTTGIALYQQALEPWLQKHKGVAVKLVPVQWSANVQAILGGSASDIIWDNYAPAYMSPSGNLLLGLDKLIQRDGIDVTKWSSSQINSYRTAAPDHGLYMLPNYFSPLAYVVRLSDFDAEGYQRPNPNWTYTEFQTVCKQMTKTLSNGKKRVGAVVQWYTNTLADAEWPFYAFQGGNGIVTSQGMADLTSQSAFQAGQFLYEDLFWPGYATTRDTLDPNAHPNAQINDEVVIQLVWGSLPLVHAQTYTGFIWDYYLPPAYPSGPTCMGTDDFFAIPITSKQPELAWSLLKFISYDASPNGWQQSNMRISLIQPCLNALWDVWAQTLRSVAPPLVGKNLEIFRTMAFNGRAFPEEYFPIGDPQIRSVPNTQIADLWNQQTSVVNAFTQIQHQINGTLKPLIAAAAIEERTAKSIAAVQPSPTATYATPIAKGVGNPPTPATSYAVNSGGTWTILGAGSSISDTADDLIFACQATDQSEASWTCRLTAIANISEKSGGAPTLDNWTQAGLMARGDLSDNAAFVALFVSGAYGFDFVIRTGPGQVLQQTKFLFWKNKGLVQQLMSPLSTPASNFLNNPVWLRLSRKGTSWSPYASMDGKNFVLLTTAQTALALGGAWMGLAASANNTDDNNQGYFRATFDDLAGFTPNTTVAIGTSGLPPAAGAVPADWATMPSLGTSGTPAAKSSSKAG